MACFLIGSLVSQWPVGYVSDLVGRRAIMAGLSIVSIVCCMLALVIPTDSILFYLDIVVLGAAAIPMYSICIAYANDRLEPHQIVAASGSLVMVAGFGAMTGPIVIAFFMDMFDISFYFWGIASVFMIIFFFTLIRIGARAGIAIEDQSALVAGPMGTPIAEYLAPDSVEYAEAVSRHEVEQLDLREDITERQL
jgi:MFS family permease